MSKQLMFLLSVYLLASSVYSDKTKITGDEKVSAEFPYQVSLEFNNYYSRLRNISNLQDSQAPRFFHICGGSVVNENFIVTTANCINRIPIDMLSVLAGTTNLDDEAGGSRHMIDNCIAHPGFNEVPDFTPNDVAVCKLTTPFVFGEKIAPIELETSYIDGDVDCIVSGWGEFITDQSKTHLQSAPKETLSKDRCRGMLGGGLPEVLCARSQKPCVGEQGSPLVLDGKLIGIFSFNRRNLYCIDTYTPDVFTRVSIFVEWITKNTSA